MNSRKFQRSENRKRFDYLSFKRNVDYYHGLLVIFLLSTAWLTVWSRPAGAQLQKEDFPPGRGREILEASCTSCHDLEEVKKLRGKLTADGWRAIVKTMTDYGAQVDSKDVGALVEYLNRNFGKQP